MWNLALATAQQTTLHGVEVTFNNALFEAGVRATAKRSLRYGQIACWLDVRPSLLPPREEAAVAEARKNLGSNRRRCTPGHLVARLGFGFWVRLCHARYDQGNRGGPQLWPTATRAFPGCPKSKRNRSDIGRPFGELRDIRNDVAHHQPVWDKNPPKLNARARTPRLDERSDAARRYPLFTGRCNLRRRPERLSSRRNRDDVRGGSYVGQAVLVTHH